MIWTLDDIVNWHVKTFPNVDLKSQKLKFLEEYREYLESGDIMELADMGIVYLVLSQRFNCDIFVDVMLDEQSKIKNLTELDNAVCKKMDINAKRKWIYKDGVYRHED